MSEEKKVIMAIGGHIGDAELTSGGYLATMALKGYSVITVALTGGERGNPLDMTVAEYREQKEKEADAFAKMLGGEAIVFSYADGELPDNEEVRLKLCDVIRQYQPCALLTHWKNSIHKDHEATHRIVKDAQFLAGLPGLERKYPAHFAKGPYYAENWEDSAGFEKYIFLEVTKDGFDLWKRAIDTHWFAVHSVSFPYKEYYEHLMRCNGCLARKEYAEAFNMDEEQKKVIISEL